MASSIERFAAAVLAGVLTASLATAAEQWLKLTSSHFELYTTAGEKKGREAILFFEQVCDFFGRARGAAKPVTNAPVRIIAFRSDKEYKPYRISEPADAFYLDGYESGVCARSSFNRALRAFGGNTQKNLRRGNS